jgi:hypothetical protein
MTLLHTPHDDTRRARRWAATRVTSWLVLGLVMAQLAGCAARFWPPSAWSLSVDLPYYARPAPAPAPAPSPAIAPDSPTPPRLKDPTNASEAMAYAEALCKLPPAELTAEIERLKIINARDGHDPLRAQQLAFAQQLAQLYTVQERLQESNQQQTLLLHERQRRIEQLTDQIEAMRAMEFSLPAAAGGSAPLASARKPAGAAAPRGATGFAIPSAPRVSKPLAASATGPAKGREELDATVNADTRPPPEP